jgi:hypothetical protein
MDALRSKLITQGSTSSDFKTFGLHYPAIWADPPSFGSTAMWNSVYTGINQLNAALVWERANCPSEKIVLFGYSQGASVIQQSLRELAVSRPDIISSGQIIGLVLIGDLNRVANGAETLWTANNTPAAAGSAMVSTNAIWGLASMPDTGPIPAALTSRTISLCHPLDFYCDPSPGSTIYPHWNYDANNWAEPKAIGQWMANRILAG